MRGYSSSAKSTIAASVSSFGVPLSKSHNSVGVMMATRASRKALKSFFRSSVGKSSNIVESDSIVERIGDSSSMGSRIPIVLKSGGIAVSQSLGRKLDRAMV